MSRRQSETFEHHHNNNALYSCRFTAYNVMFYYITSFIALFFIIKRVSTFTLPFVPLLVVRVCENNCSIMMIIIALLINRKKTQVP